MRELEQKDSRRLRLWFAASFLGRPSEVWLGRQIRLIERFDLEVLCWGMPEAPAWDVSAPVYVIDGLPPGRRWLSGQAEDLFARWRARIAGLRTCNFYRADHRSRHRIEALAARSPPDIILAHFGHTALALAPFARRHGIPLVVHFHGHDISYALANRWYRWSLMSHLDDFAHMVVVGTHQRELLRARGVDPGRISLIPCGVPTDMFDPPENRATNPARFLVVSRLVPSKGVDVTLEAFARVQAQIPEAQLTIVGDGPERAALEAQAARLGVAVTFLGAVPWAQVHAQMETATVYLQHSLGRADYPLGSEGSPVAIAEASTMALPVVVSHCGGVDALVREGETGFVVAQRDVEGMARAMLTLARDSELCHRMGWQGRAHVAAHFNTTSQVCQLEETLLGVLAARSDEQGETT